MDTFCCTSISWSYKGVKWILGKSRDFHIEKDKEAKGRQLYQRHLGKKIIFLMINNLLPICYERE